MLIQIVLAGALIVFAILAGVTTYWQAIIALPASAAAFLGALTGAGGGLFAIILGALINAELNRRRDDRLRREEGRSLALSLHGEMLSVADTYRRHKEILATTMERWRDSASSQTCRVYDRVPCSIAIFSKCSDRVGLLEDPDLIADLAQFYSALPTKEEWTDVRIEDLPQICHDGDDADDARIERAEHLAEQLEIVADRLARPA